MAQPTLWAPWRMAYIRGPKTGGCVFCELPRQGAAHHRDNLILCTRPEAFVIMNRFPFAWGHVMVVPRRHVSDLVALSPGTYTALFALLRDALGALRKATGAEGINVGINMGAAAGAGIAEHVHIHLVPRWPGDVNFMPMIADVRVMPEALAESYDRLVGAFAPLTARRAARPRRARGAGR